MEAKSLKWIAVLLIVTLLPAMAIYWFNKNNTFRKSAAPRPIWPIGMKENGKDTAFFQIPIFSAVNADSQIVTTEKMDGNVSVIEVFFTECESICPIMNKQMERVFSVLSRNKNLKIFSYTIDPNRDDLQKLKLYADKHDADLSQWYFLRANLDSLIQFANVSLRISADSAILNGDIPHTERFVLVDWNRNIRGYYNGTDSTSINTMMSHIVLLMSEKDRMDRKAGK
jgi:protein SCO1/2